LQFCVGEINIFRLQNTKMLFPANDVINQQLHDDLFHEKQVHLSVLRLDAIHPVVSGNKLFKLHYFLQTAIQQSYEGIVTFGGPYSNHLVATAFACKTSGLKCTGIIRGEQPAFLSHTITKCCNDYGMVVKFIPRNQYDEREQPFFIKDLKLEYPNCLIVPDGGYHPMGAAGAALIMDLINEDATHVCCAVGTATTLAGLMLGKKDNQQIIAIPVLKNMHDLQNRIEYLTNCKYSGQHLQTMPDYHFGGYAKKNKELIDSMNQLYEKYRLPTDFVYTGKLMYGIIDSIKNGSFPKGSKIVCVHTGGLQGNLSLPPGTLVF